MRLLACFVVGQHGRYDGMVWPLARCHYIRTILLQGKVVAAILKEKLERAIYFTFVAF